MLFLIGGGLLRALRELPFDDIAITVFRLAASMALSFVLGLLCSILMFERPLVEAFFIPLIRLLMAVPAVCWVVFAILWFKGVEPESFSS